NIGSISRASTWKLRKECGFWEVSLLWAIFPVLPSRGMDLSRLPRTLICACVLLAALPTAGADPSLRFLDEQVAAHPGQSGSYVLDTGAEALIARAWLADHAERT